MELKGSHGTKRSGGACLLPLAQPCGVQQLDHPEHPKGSAVGKELWEETRGVAMWLVSTALPGAVPLSVSPIKWLLNGRASPEVRWTR